MVSGTGNPPEGNALPRTEVKAEEGSVRLPSQVSQSWKQNIFQKKMWKGISSVGSKFISSIDYVDNTVCSTLGVGNNRGDRNNVKNIPQRTSSEGFIERQDTYENSDGEEEAKEQKEKEEKSEREQEQEQENESEETEKEGYKEQKNKEDEDKKDRQNKENNKSRENKENTEGNSVEEKESNDKNYSEADDNELHELHALNTITNSPTNHTGSTITKRGSLRLSFEAAMSLRRRNLSLKEQNLTAC